MEFYHLRSFVVVAETKNLTQAAKRLCSTPPAISAHIKTLEQELDTTLFIRTSKGMTLTEKGQLLLVKAQKTLDSAIDMVNLAADNQDDLIGHFQLGLNQNIQALRCTTLVNNLIENCPGITLQLNQSSTGKIIKDIQSAQLDGGYIYGEVPEDFTAIAIKKVEITTIAPINFDQKQLNDTNNLASSPWITMAQYCPFDKELKRKLGTNIHAQVNSDHDQSRLELVKSGLGLSFLELSLAQPEQSAGNIQIVPQLNFQIPLSFVVLTTRLNNPVVKAIRQEMNILWGISI
ncbi:LysR family transcriptional regulator [Thalassotalea sp. SU-HH00458]|uniref:LysR family transcriptional regulator n=1 Tax=Thalassotalea sp. SU-HH00458 TaxID=3127657 RepID=UPI00310A3E3C